MGAPITIGEGEKYPEAEIVGKFFRRGYITKPKSLGRHEPANVGRPTRGRAVVTILSSCQVLKLACPIAAMMNARLHSASRRTITLGLIPAPSPNGMTALDESPSWRNQDAALPDKLWGPVDSLNPRSWRAYAHEMNMVTGILPTT